MLDEEILAISESKDLACDIVNVDIGFPLASLLLYLQIHWYLKRYVFVIFSLHLTIFLKIRLHYKPLNKVNYALNLTLLTLMYRGIIHRRRYIRRIQIRSCHGSRGWIRRL